ncbi:hypothetical protein SCP_1800460 [Sparassis crispa]|uniref:Ribonuclease H1 N-terminal domain-containing protein n=1 Tax=Sparassis crispa TaxID=139825 RepID=A0A401H6I1_9APHY|nr:hypothetical protein SCP_1800460 [Sparassis crispa]GBE90024.1 hypothetical protein SCP_1800460 [Sparassis crispa]
MFVPLQLLPVAQGFSAQTPGHDWASIRLALEYTLAWVTAVENEDFCQCNYPRPGDPEVLDDLGMCIGDMCLDEPVGDNGKFVGEMDFKQQDLSPGAGAALVDDPAAPAIAAAPVVVAAALVVIAAAPIIVAAAPAIIPAPVTAAASAALAIVGPVVTGPGPIAQASAGPAAGAPAIAAIAAVPPAGPGGFEIPPGFAAAPGIELPCPAQPNDHAPFYCMMHERVVGVFNDWSIVAAYIHGIPGAFCKKYPSYFSALSAFNVAHTQGTVQVL